eukprot:10964766-Ditylum_brightwellii.AAC.1
MPGSNKTNKSGPGTITSPNKNQVAQDFEESSNSSSQSTSDNSRFRAQQDSKKQRLSSIDDDSLLRDSDNTT